MAFKSESDPCAETVWLAQFLGISISINAIIEKNNKDLSLKDTIEKVVKKLNHGIKLRDDITMLGIDLKN